jgi:hypothetical protein
VYVNTEQAVHTLYASSALLQCLRVWYLRPLRGSLPSPAPLSPTLTPGGLCAGIGEELVATPLTAGLVALSSSAQEPMEPLEPRAPGPRREYRSVTCQAFYPLVRDGQEESMADTKIRMTHWLRAHSSKCLLLALAHAYSLIFTPAIIKDYNY